jgi:hypothetical protein
MDKARTVRRLREAGLTDIEICARLELPLKKGYPSSSFIDIEASRSMLPKTLKNCFLPLVGE